MRPLHRWLAAAALALAPLPAGAEEPTGSPEAPYAIGDRVEDAVGKDLDGEEVRLSGLAVTKERAWAAVARAADVFGAAGAAKPSTRFGELAPLRAAGGVDPAGKEGLVGEAGRGFGLVPHPDRVARMETLGDVAGWIEGSAKAPVVVVVWSPACKVCKNGADAYLNALAGETGARLVVLAPAFGYADTEDSIRAYLDAKSWVWRVVPDADRALTGRFGGTLTPHAMVVDPSRTLRYRGALYQAADEAKGEPREWLREAIEAVKAGRPVATPSTEPVGCPIPRPRA